MGAVDTEGKQYLSINRFFADMFNFLLYDGKSVMLGAELQGKTHYAMPVKKGLYF